jgi:hypothetical protein
MDQIDTCNAKKIDKEKEEKYTRNKQQRISPKYVTKVRLQRNKQEGTQIRFLYIDVHYGLSLLKSTVPGLYRIMGSEDFLQVSSGS